MTSPFDIVKVSTRLEGNVVMTKSMYMALITERNEAL